MTTPLKQLCDLVLDAAGKVTAKRPWKFSSSIDGRRGSIYEGDGYMTVCAYAPDSYWAKTASGNVEPFKYIVTAANNTEAMARALLVMEEALEHYSVIADRDGALGRDRREVARGALARANEILDGK